MFLLIHFNQTHLSDYPILAHMARDILDIPGVSISVEWLFSSSKHTLSNAHSSMMVESTSKTITAKEWLKKGFGYEVHYLENVRILGDAK